MLTYDPMSGNTVSKLVFASKPGCVGYTNHAERLFCAAFFVFFSLDIFCFLIVSLRASPLR